MNKRILMGFVLLVFGYFATPAGAHGLGGSGHAHGGFHGGGFHGGFAHPGLQGFSHFDHFQHEQFFGPPHHFGPFVPPGHEEHFEHELFFGPHHHFEGFQRGFPHGFFSHDRGFLGGSSFFAGSSFGEVSDFPFFCVPHQVGFTDQALFFDHLHQAHGIPRERVWSFCYFLSSGQLGFFGP